MDTCDTTVGVAGFRYAIATKRVCGLSTSAKSARNVSMDTLPADLDSFWALWFWIVSDFKTVQKHGMCATQWSDATLLGETGSYRVWCHAT